MACFTPKFLKDDVLGTLKDLGIKKKDVYFQQDNDPKHTGVRFGSGLGVMGLNLNLHLEVRFKYLVNLNPNRRFRFEMFGSVRTMFDLYRFHFFIVFAFIYLFKLHHTL